MAKSPRTDTQHDSVWDACGDPHRRTLLTALRRRPHSAGELGALLPVTQSAVSQHLRVLRDAGLVDVTPRGTSRIYHLNMDGLAEVRRWVEQFWDDALSAFAAEATRTATEASSTRSRRTPEPGDRS